ncbi:MAG: YfhO family protein [bacterium]|nr:YfhO family protein [bacterium]
MFNGAYSPLKPQKELKLITFFTALITAAAIFVPFIIKDSGYFLFYGDFNVQQIPFYKLCHEAVKSGNIFWNWTTDLGANFIGSYTFYLLGSPFFWLTLPFPNWMVPYLLGPLLILKFALSALCAYIYLRRFTKTPQAAMLGGLLYAFCGFSIYNIFFNHFHEAIVFFPLLLTAIERFITQNKRGEVILAVFICALSNYFFFFGMVVFAIIYWFVRTLSHCYKQTFKRFLAFAFECVLGVMLTAALLLPTLYAVLGMSRVSQFLNGWNAITYGKEQIYLNIIQCFFFPPDLPARPVFFPGADVKWSSLGGWLPVFSMCGVFAWMQGKKGHWLRRVLGITIFMALVPILNSVFYMLNTAYYARWFFIPILMMCLATVMSLEDRQINWRTAYKWCAGVTAAFVVVIGFFPQKNSDNTWRFGLYTPDAGARFWCTCIIALLGLAVLFELLMIRKKYPRSFFKTSIVMVCIVSVIYGSVFVHTGKKVTDDANSVLIPQLVELDVNLPDDPNTFRIDVFNGYDNTAMYLGYSSINAFHSIVPSSIFDFWQYVGQERNVASRPEVENYASRSLLSVKYLLLRENDESFLHSDGSPKMPGFKYLKTENHYDVYINQNYIPYGFTYDYYITSYECEYYGIENRSFMMLKAMLLTPEQIDKYSHILKPLSDEYELGQVYDSEDELPTRLVFNEETLSQDCAARAASTAQSFEVDNKGFTAKTTLDRANLVFFSVPYDKGWSATVNGNPVEIERVNSGFMAVLAPRGDSTIRFDYKTPGLDLGIVISVSSLIVLAIYLLVCLILRKYRPENFNNVSFPEGDALREKFLAYDIADSVSTPVDDFFEAPLDVPQQTDSNKSDYYKGFEGGFVIDFDQNDKELDD